MNNKRREREGSGPKSGKRGFHKLLSDCLGNPEDIEDQDWYLDGPDVRLTRIFSVVLILHIIAIGGILAFKMIDKATGPDGTTVSKANVTVSQGTASELEVAASVEPEDRPANPFTGAGLQASSRQYQVGSDETLPEIAAKLGVNPEMLRIVNAIHSDREIYPGMWLDIPPVDGGTRDFVSAEFGEEIPETVAEKGAGSGERYADTGEIYIVQKGETAYGIARKYGIHHSTLLEYNGIERPELLQAGAELRIPRVD